MRTKQFILAVVASTMLFTACSYQTDGPAITNPHPEENAVQETVINNDDRSAAALTNLANATEKLPVNTVLSLSNGDMVVEFGMTRTEVENLIGADSIKASTGIEHYIDVGISLYYINDTVAAMKPITADWSLPSGISLGSPKEDVLAAYEFTSIADNGVNQLFCTVEDGEITTIDWDTFIDAKNKDSKYFMSINANVGAYDIMIRDWRFMELYTGTGL